MKWGLSLLLSVALTGCAASSPQAHTPRALAIASLDQAGAQAFGPLSEAQLDWMRAALTTTARNPLIPAPTNEPGDTSPAMLLAGSPFDPATARAAEGPGHTGPNDELLATVVRPMATAWASDAQLGRAYRFRLLCSWDGVPPATWLKDDATVLQVFGWPMAYHSASKRETLLVYVRPDKTLTVRMSTGDVLASGP